MKCQVNKSILIEADLGDVRSRIINFHHWKAWSPWSVLEPDHHQEIEGDAGTAGSRMTWEGLLLGSGVNTLVSIDDRELVFNLRFLEPYRSEARVAFSFAESKEGVRVTWTMETNVPFFLFFRIEQMKTEIGMAYGRGLALLKELVEKGVIEATTTDQGIVNFPGYSYIGLKRTSTFEEIPQGLMADYGRLYPLLKETDPDQVKAVAIYIKANMSKNRMTYIAGVPKEALREAEPGRDFLQDRIPAQKVLEIRHCGAYRFIGNAWAMGMMTARSRRMKPSSPPFEYYHNDAYSTAERDLVTSIYIPVSVS